MKNGTNILIFSDNSQKVKIISIFRDKGSWNLQTLIFPVISKLCPAHFRLLGPYAHRLLGLYDRKCGIIFPPRNHGCFVQQHVEVMVVCAAIWASAQTCTRIQMYTPGCSVTHPYSCGRANTGVYLCTAIAFYEQLYEDTCDYWMGNYVWRTMWREGRNKAHLSEDKCIQP